MIDLIKGLTKSSPERIAAMEWAVAKVEGEDISGAIVECGVWRGGNIVLARLAAPERICWLYDTFDGMTEPGKFDVKRSGAAASDVYARKKDAGGKWDKVSVDEVKSNLRSSGVFDEEKLKFVIGDVESTLLDPNNLPEKIAVLRLDTDWYASTKIELEVLYPRLSSGGVLIIDDYGHWKGAQKAVDDYFGSDRPALRMIDYTAVMAVKP